VVSVCLHNHSENLCINKVCFKILLQWEVYGPRIFGITACLALTAVCENSTGFSLLARKSSLISDASIRHTTPIIVTQTPLGEIETLSLETYQSPHSAFLSPSEYRQGQTALNAANKVLDLILDNIGKPCFHHKLLRLPYDSDQTKVSHGTRCEEYTVKIGHLIQQVIKKDTY